MLVAPGSPVSDFLIGQAVVESAGCGVCTSNYSALSFHKGDTMMNEVERDLTGYIERAKKYFYDGYT